MPQVWIREGKDVGTSLLGPKFSVPFRHLARVIEGKPAKPRGRRLV